MPLSDIYFLLQVIELVNILTLWSCLPLVAFIYYYTPDY